MISFKALYVTKVNGRYCRLLEVRALFFLVNRECDSCSASLFNNEIFEKCIRVDCTFQIQVLLTTTKRNPTGIWLVLNYSFFSSEYWSDIQKTDVASEEVRLR